MGNVCDDVRSREGSGECSGDTYNMPMGGGGRYVCMAVVGGIFSATRQWPLHIHDVNRKGPGNDTTTLKA